VAEPKKIGRPEAREIQQLLAGNKEVFVIKARDHDAILPVVAT